MASLTPQTIFGFKGMKEEIPEELRNSQGFARLLEFLEKKGLDISKLTFAGREAVERSLEFGFNLSTVGDTMVLWPRVSYDDFVVYKRSKLPAVAGGIETFATEMMGLSGSSFQHYVNFHKLVRITEGAVDKHSVMPLLTPFSDVPLGRDIRYDEEYIAECYEAVEALEKRPTKAFDFARVIEDKRLRSKYRITERQSSIVEALMYTDPIRCAEVLSVFMTLSQARTKVRVRILRAVFSVDLAKSNLKNGLWQFNVRELPMTVSDDRAYVYTGADEYGLRPEVSGPTEHMAEVAMVATAVLARGGSAVLTAFETELVSLDIQISGGLNPIFPVDFPVLHSAAQLPEPNDVIPASVVRDALELCSDAIVKVRDEAGEYGSALVVDDGVVLVASHTLSAAVDPHLGDAPLEVYKHAGRDLHFARAKLEAVPFVLRTPVVGDMVTLVCRARDGSLRVCSEVKVLCVEAGLLRYESRPDMVPGCSGGVLIAGDGRVVGLHSGVTSESAFGSAVSRRTVDLARTMVDGDLGGQALHTHFSGAASRIKAVLQHAEVVPITMLKRTLALSYAGKRYLCPDYEPPTGDWKYIDGYYVAEGGDDRVLPYAREALLGEVVYAVGADALVYGKAHVTETGKWRVVTSPLALPACGAVLFAADGCVVGFSGRYTTYSSGGPAVVFRTIVNNPEVMPEDVADWLAAQGLPGLDPPESVVSHSSVGGFVSPAQLTWARIGDAYLKMTACKDALDRGVADALVTTQLSQRLSNKRMSGICQLSGLAACAKFGAGCRPPEDSKAFADLVEALFGWLSDESPDDANYLRVKLGLCFETG